MNGMWIELRRERERERASGELRKSKGRGM